MSSINDITLGEFSNLSYVEMPIKLEEMVEAGDEVTLKELAELSIDYYLKKVEGEGPDHNREIIDVLEKCRDGEYQNYKIIKYENDNNGTGFVGYAIETNSNEVIIASRGSEMPKKDNKEGEEGGKAKGWEDWIDNGQIATKYETIQQEAAKEFLNDVGSKYSSIYLTGHSKGGNNVLYAAITADKDVQDKIVSCVTFNAPGFSDKFIERYKSVINELNGVENTNKKGIFKEYQGSSDLVSSIMNNVSEPLIIKQKQLNKTFFERLKGFDDHYIYAMEMDGDTFVLEEDKEKDLVPIFVNNLVAGLTATLSDKEIDEIIDLVNDILNKDEDSSKLDIAKMLLDSGVDLSTVKVVFLQVISEAIMIHLKESPIVLIAGVGYIIDFYMDTKTFIYANQARVKNYIKDGLFKLGKFLAKESLKNGKSIINSSLKISPVIISTAIINPKVTDLINNVLITNKCLVKVEDINTALNTYKLELGKVKENFKKVDLSMKKLVDSGWTGQAGFVFYSVKFVIIKSSMGKIENQLSHMVKYLERAKKEFENRELEEDSLVNLLA